MKLKQLAIAAAIALMGMSTAACGDIGVYMAKKEGEAELAKAVSSKQVAVETAKANLESAKLNAQAEIERAKGTDQANRIMASSLGGPENYLRWSYIDMLRDTAGRGDRQVIYLPTESGMPILEAGKR